jgi:hypothetical protein
MTTATNSWRAMLFTAMTCDKDDRFGAVTGQLWIQQRTFPMPVFYQNIELVLVCFGCFSEQREERCGCLDVAGVVYSLSIDYNSDKKVVLQV